MALQQIGLDATINGVPDFTAGINTMNKAVDSFAQNGQDAGKGFSAFGEIVTGALRQVGVIAVQALQQAGRAVAGFVKDSINVAGDFEAGMHKFQAVAGDAVDTKGLEKFKDLFISLGKELPVSTSEVEQAAIEMVSGGIDPAIVAAGALRSTIQFAAASGLSLADAAATSAKFLAGWTSASATTAEKVDFLTTSTDALTKAAAASSTTAAELRLGIFNVQGAAQALHAPFTDVVATLAELAPAFESSAQAGTALNVFMTRLVPQTDKAAGAMSDLGIITKSGQNVFFDAQGSFLGMANAAEVLKDKLGGMTDAQKIATLHELFGNDAMKVANLLMIDGAAGVDAMKAKMDAANGVSATAALMQSGYNTALENAKGSVEALQIRIGSFLIPVLTDLLNNWIAPGINSITSFSEAFFKLVPAIQASDDPIQTFLNALKIAAPQFLDIISKIESFKDGLVDFAAAAKPVTDFIGDNLTPILFGVGTVIAVTVVPAMTAAAVAFAAAAAPIVALGVAAALLYAGWENDFGGMRTTVTAFWNDTLLPAFTDIKAWLDEKIPPAIEALSKFWTDTLLPAIKEVGDFLNEKVFPVLSDLVDVYIKAAKVEIKALADLWSNVLQPALKTAWGFINDSVIPIFHALFDVEFAIAKKAVEALTGLWQKELQPALKAVGEYIDSTVMPAFKSIGEYLSATFGPILKDAGEWLSDITGGFSGVTGGVKDVVHWLENLASSISNLKLPDWLTPGSPTPWEIALLGIGKALSALPGALSGMQEGISDVGDQIADTFQSTDLVDVLEGLGEDIMGGFIHGIKNAWGGVEDIINSTADNVEDAFKGAFGSNSPATRMMPIGEDVSMGVLEGIKSAWPGLVDQVGSLTTDLINSMQGIGDRMNDAIADSFGSTASIDRQIAKNLDRFKDILPQYQQYTQGALNEAQLQAREFADPAQGAKFFKMRSDQILEYAKLQKDLDEAATQDDRDRIQAQMLLINQAQTAEIAQFNATKAAASPLLDIAAAIKKMLDSIGPVLADDPRKGLVDQLQSLWAQLQTPVSTTRTPYNPGTTNNSTAYNLNMPIYTSQSPSVLQDSMAILGAGTFL